MKKILSILAALFAISMFTVETEAARLGGGRSVGTQRSITQQPVQKTAPTQQQSANTAPQTPPAQPPSGMSRWLGPLAGLALGAGLASLFLNNGFGGALMGILMVLALVAAGVFVFRLLTRKSAPQQPLRYANAGAGASNTPPVQQPTAFTGNVAPGSVAATLGGGVSPTSANSPWPADFDAVEFERQAKLNFMRLQAANDAGDASTLRDFMTPTLYRDIETQMKSAWGTPQKTEVSGLNAEVVDVVTDSGLYVVSVRFTGDVRENDGAAQPLNEYWHLEKPLSGRSGWLVSGIQQAA